MIDDIRARKIINSRAKWAIEIELKRKGKWFRASVPAGKSRGKNEAVQISAEQSMKKFIEFKSIIKHHEFQNQEELDNFLIESGGKNKEKFGVDLILATSIAYFQSEQQKAISLPTPMLNIINGGMHAGNDLSIQEFMIVPLKAEKFSDKIQIALDVYDALKKILEKKYGSSAINVGDEGGFAPPLKTTEEALMLIEKAIEEVGRKGEVSIALDCAASSYFNEGEYSIDSWKLSIEDYIDYISEISKKFNLFSIEDPLHEENFNGFSQLLRKTKSLIVGDDITVTNLELIEKAHKLKSINALLVKPNQIGTITETLNAINFCRKAGWSWIISHRSGETESSFIADFAAITESPFIKAGAPARSERTAKYNQLLRIEESLE